MSVIRYGRDDLRLFSEASHDRSRLHMSDEYARRTSYGEAIVFGILGAFSCLGELRDRPGMALAKVSLTYRSALYMDVDYRASANERSDNRAGVVVADGQGGSMMSSDFRFREATGADSGPAGFAGIAPVLEQSEWSPEDLVEGVEVSGRYAPEPGPLREIMGRWRLAEKGATPPQVAALLWSSYLTGMHLPGLRGTSAQLQLTFRSEATAPRVPFDYRSRVVGFDERFRLLHTSTELSGPEGIFADAEVWSLVREDPTPPPPA